MPFIFAEKIPYCSAVASHRLHHLFGFRHRNAWIVLTLYDEQRFCDLACIVIRRDGEQKLSHLRISFITVLGAAKISAVLLRALQECDEIADPYYIDCAFQAIVEVGHRRKHHITTVRTAYDRYPLCIEFGPRGYPVEKLSYIFHGIFALEAVIELQVALTIACRSAHVRNEHRSAE